MTKFLTMADGEYAECPKCAPDYGVDAWHPVTTEFWDTYKGRMIFSQCKACRRDARAGVKGVVPANDAEWRAIA